jgi:hypothetical protein
VISESTTAHTATSVNATFAPLGTFNHVSFEYNSQSVYVYEPLVVGPTVRALASSDLTAGHIALPAGAVISTMLTSVDMMPITVNPTWWAYDAYNLNPRGARAAQHADMQRLNNGEGYNSDNGTSSGSFSLVNTGLTTFERNGDACIELPFASNVPGVAAGNSDAVNGVYANGGQLRAFDSASYFGFFIVRKDSKISVPSRSGQDDVEGASATRSHERPCPRERLPPPDHGEPDGRFAAAVLKTTSTTSSWRPPPRT